MKKKLVNNLILGVICISVLFGLLNVASFPVDATLDIPPTPSEKHDLSRGRAGYSVLPQTTKGTLNSAAAITDQFGYTTSNVSSPWINAKISGTPISLDPDDDYQEVAIGFDFPFYENTYSSIYISTNGILTFLESSDAFENRDIPRDSLPNNYIAPLWDDLLFTAVDGKVYYTSGEVSGVKYFVVEWYKISRLDSPTDVLTFEVVLYENGNILFQYNQLAGTLDQATVGIEDEQGVDGSLIHYNDSTGLNTVDDILFVYPSPSARVKIYPVNQGGLLPRMSHMMISSS